MKELENIKEWISGLQYEEVAFEQGQTPGDNDGGEVYDFVISSEDTINFSYIINEIYNTIKNCYDYNNTYTNLNKLKKFYPNLTTGFMEWFNNYSKDSEKKNLKNKTLFDINNPTDFYYSIICYISGMTDKFAINMYNEIIGY